MNNNIKSLSILILFCMFSLTAYSADKFDLIKDKIGSAAVARFLVLITIESKIFGDVDSLPGQIILAEDGRYRAEINGDIYLNDGQVNWEYSAENNQVTKRKLLKGELTDNRLSFFKNLDSSYETIIEKKDILYKLIKLKDADEALPDSMIITLEKTKPKISRIEYFDINDDLNCIYINEEFYETKINENLFEINLPDSVEIISLP